MADPQRLDLTRCPLCGQPNACAMAAGSPGDCWCTQVRIGAELIDRIPADDRGRACVCANCVQAAEAAPNPSAAKAAPPSIGVFDSGLGGLTVLRALHAALPGAPLVYVADSAHAPYGEKDDAFITKRARFITRWLLAQGAGLIVVACNTATAASIAALRAEFAVPFVGLEPAIKPALAAGFRRIGVMATPATLRSDKFAALLQASGDAARVLPQPCPGLAAAIERGDPQSPELAQAVQTFCAPLRAAGCDAVVLGCTHYPLVAEQIRVAIGAEVPLIDSADAVARQAVRLWPHPPLPARPAPRLFTSGDVALLARMAERCGLPHATVGAWDAL